MSASLAVRQFVGLARGEMVRQSPRNRFRTVAVRGEKRYCLHCKGMQWTDVIWYWPFGSTLMLEAGHVCRSCLHLTVHPGMEAGNVLS